MPPELKPEHTMQTTIADLANAPPKKEISLFLKSALLPVGLSIDAVGWCNQFLRMRRASSQLHEIESNPLLYTIPAMADLIAAMNNGGCLEAGVSDEFPNASKVRINPEYAGKVAFYSNILLDGNGPSLLVRYGGDGKALDIAYFVDNACVYLITPSGIFNSETLPKFAPRPSAETRKMIESWAPVEEIESDPEQIEEWAKNGRTLDEKLMWYSYLCTLKPEESERIRKEAKKSIVEKALSDVVSGSKSEAALDYVLNGSKFNFTLVGERAQSIGITRDELFEDLTNAFSASFYKELVGKFEQWHSIFDEKIINEIKTAVNNGYLPRLNSLLVSLAHLEECDKKCEGREGRKEENTRAAQRVQDILYITLENMAKVRAGKFGDFLELYKRFCNEHTAVLEETKETIAKDLEHFVNELKTSSLKRLKRSLDNGYFGFEPALVRVLYMGLEKAVDREIGMINAYCVDTPRLIVSGDYEQLEQIRAAIASHIKQRYGVELNAPKLEHSIAQAEVNFLTRQIGSLYNMFMVSYAEGKYCADVHEKIKDAYAQVQGLIRASKMNAEEEENAYAALEKNAGIYLAGCDNVMGRNYVVAEELANNGKPDEIEKLDELLGEMTGARLSEYNNVFYFIMMTKAVGVNDRRRINLLTLDLTAGKYSSEEQRAAWEQELNELTEKYEGNGHKKQQKANLTTQTDSPVPQLPPGIIAVF